MEIDKTFLKLKRVPIDDVLVEYYDTNGHTMSASEEDAFYAARGWTFEEIIAEVNKKLEKDKISCVNLK